MTEQKFVTAVRAEDGTRVAWTHAEMPELRFLNVEQGGWSWSAEVGRDALFWWAVNYIASAGPDTGIAPEFVAQARELAKQTP